jgi:predicted nucleotidyltransferase
MRLSDNVQKSIREAIYAIMIDIPYSLWLFGSRVDDSKRGGDIDLLIVVETEAQLAAAQKLEIRLLVLLKEKIGEQKIDLVFATRNRLDADPFIAGILPSRVFLDERNNTSNPLRIAARPIM